MERRGLPLIKCCLIYLLNYPLETEWGSLFFSEGFSGFTPLVALSPQQSECLSKAEDPTEWNVTYLSNEIIVIMEAESWMLWNDKAWGDGGWRKKSCWSNMVISCSFQRRFLKRIRLVFRYNSIFSFWSLKYKLMRERQRASPCVL